MMSGLVAFPAPLRVRERLLFRRQPEVAVAEAGRLLHHQQPGGCCQDQTGHQMGLGQGAGAAVAAG